MLLLAHAREERQISLLVLHDSYVSIHLQISWSIFTKSCQRCNFLSRPAQNPRNPRTAASAVCAMLQPFAFASGGHDHVVHYWQMEDDFSSVSSELLPVKHGAVIQSLLAIRDTSHKLVTASADCNVHIFDLSSEHVAHTLKLSNSVYHIHKTATPFCVLLGVSSIRTRCEKVTRQ